jgi:hypothetical protein
VLGEESANEIGLRQEWTETFATTFPAHADVRRRVEMKVARREIEDLLNASARVVQHGEQDVIAFAVGRRPVHLREKVSELLLAQVSEEGTEGLLARNGEHGLAHTGQGRFRAATYRSAASRAFRVRGEFRRRVSRSVRNSKTTAAVKSWMVS